MARNVGAVRTRRVTLLETLDCSRKLRRLFSEWRSYIDRTRVYRFQRIDHLPRWLELRGFESSRSSFGRLCCTHNTALFSWSGMGFVIMVFKDVERFAPITYTDLPGYRRNAANFFHEVEIYATGKVRLEDVHELVYTPAAVRKASLRSGFDYLETLEELEEAGVRVRRWDPTFEDYQRFLKGHLLSFVHCWDEGVLNVRVLAREGTKVRECKYTDQLGAAYVDRTIIGESRDPEVLKVAIDHTRPYDAVKELRDLAYELYQDMLGNDPDPRTARIIDDTVNELVREWRQGLRELVLALS